MTVVAMRRARPLSLRQAAALSILAKRGPLTSKGLGLMLRGGGNTLRGLETRGLVARVYPGLAFIVSSSGHEELHKLALVSR